MPAAYWQCINRLLIILYSLTKILLVLMYWLTMCHVLHSFWWWWWCVCVLVMGATLSLVFLGLSSLWWFCMVAGLVCGKLTVHGWGNSLVGLLSHGSTGFELRSFFQTLMESLTSCLQQKKTDQRNTPGNLKAVENKDDLLWSMREKGHFSSFRTPPRSTQSTGGSRSSSKVDLCVSWGLTISCFSVFC